MQNPALFIVLVCLVAACACPPGSRGPQGQPGLNGTNGISPSLNPLSQSIVPLTADTLTLGTSAKPFADSYVNNSHVAGALTVGGRATVGSLSTSGAASLASATVSGNLNVVHNVTASALKLTTGAKSGYQLVSDSQGNAQWKPQPAPSGAQNSTFVNGIKVFGKILPGSDGGLDIGTKIDRVNNIFAKSLHLNNTEDGGPSLSAGATTVKTLTSTGQVIVQSTLNAISQTGNALQVAGGISTQGSITVAGSIVIAGASTLDNGAITTDGTGNIVTSGTLSVQSTLSSDAGNFQTDGLGNVFFGITNNPSLNTPFGVAIVKVTSVAILGMTGTGATDFQVRPAYLSPSTGQTGYYVILHASLSPQGATNIAYAATGSPALQLYSWDGTHRIPLTSATDWPFSFWATTQTQTVSTTGLTGTAFTTANALGALTLGPVASTTITTGNFPFWLTVVYYAPFL